jgi:uncharacterized protein (TIGR02246 family)
MTDEQTIRDLIAEWHRATGAGDVEAVLELMSEDVVFLVAGRPPMEGRAAFADGLRSVLATHRIVSSGEIQELVVSGDLAYTWTSLDVRIDNKRGGESTSRQGNALSILRKQTDGRWLLVRDANLLPPA